MTSLYISKSPQECGWRMLSLVRKNRNKKSPGVFGLGDVLVNISSPALYLSHVPQVRSRCVVLHKHKEAQCSTGVCIVCSLSRSAHLPAMQIVSPPWWQAKQKVVCDINTEPRRLHPNLPLSYSPEFPLLAPLPPFFTSCLSKLLLST